MPCSRPDCQHKPKRVRADRPRCHACARRAALARPEIRKLAAANMTRGRVEKARNMPLRDDYLRARKAVGADEARRIIAEHMQARGIA